MDISEEQRSVRLNENSQSNSSLKPTHQQGKARKAARTNWERRWEGETDLRWSQDFHNRGAGEDEDEEEEEG